MAIQDLTIKISVDDQGAIKGFVDTSKALDGMGESAAGASQGLDGVSDSADQADQEVQEATGSFGKFSSTVIAVNQALELAQKAYGALSSVVSSTTDVFAVQEAAEAKVRASLKLTGQFSEEAAQGFFDFASELQSVSTIGDETTLALVAQSTALGNSAEQTENLIKASAELAAVSDDFTIETAFRQLNQTLTGTAGRLGRLIPGLSDLTKEQLAAGGAAEFINEKLGGLSEELTQTFGQRLTQASNDFGDALETVGKTFVEVFNVTEILTQVGAGIRFVNTQIDNIRNALNQVDFSGLTEQAKIFGAVLATAALPTVIKLGVAFAPVAAAAALAAAKFALISAAVLGVAAAIDIVARNLDRWTIIVDGLEVLFREAFASILRGFRNLAEGALSILDTILTPLKLLPGGLGDAFAGAVPAIKSSLGAIDKIIDSQVEKSEAAALRFTNTLDGADTGFAGKVLTEGKKFIDNFTKGTEKVKGSLKGVVGSQKASLELTKEQAAAQQAALQAQNQLLEEQKMIREGLGEGLEASQIELLRLQGEEVEVAKRLAKIRLADFDAQIAKAGELSEAQKKQAEEIRANIEKINAIQVKQAQGRQKSSGGGGGDDEVTERLVIPDVKLIDEAQINFIKSSIGEGFAGGVSQIAGVFTDFVNPIAAFGQIALGAIGAVQQIVDLPTQILDALTGLITSITEFPLKLAESFNALLDSLLKFAAEFIPNLIKAIGSIIEGLADFIVELPEVLINLLAEIPDLIFGLLDRLPEIIERVIVSLLSPDLFLAVAEFLIVKAPDIALRITEFLALKLPVIIIEAIAKGVQEAFNSFADALSGKSLLGGNLAKSVEDAGEKANEALKNVADTVNKTSETLFSAKELEEVARGNRAAAAISNAIQGSTERAKNIFQRLFDGLKRVWDLIFQNIIQPLFDGLRTVWLFIYDNVIKPLFDGLRAVWLFIYDNVIKPFLDALKVVWMFIYENIIQPLLDGLKAVWEAVLVALQAVFDVLKTIWDAVINALNAWIEFLKTAFTAIFETLRTIWEGVFEVLKGVFDAGAKVFKGVFEVFKGIAEAGAKLFKGVFDAVTDIFKIAGNLIKDAFKNPVNFFKNLPTNLKNAFKDIIKVFGGLGKTVKDAFKGVLDPIKNLGKTVKDAFGGVKDIVTNAFNDSVNALKNGVTDIFNGAGNLLEKIIPQPGESKGTIENKLGFDIPIVRFAEGGMVPGQPAVQGDSALNDRIVALLSPGEFVLNRTQVKMLEDEGVKLDALGLPGLFFGGKVKAPKIKISAPKIPKVDLSPSGISNAISTSLEGAADLLAQADPSQLFANLDFTNKIWEKVLEFVKNILKLNTGGLVPGSGGTDSVPAMLTPGEFVVNEPAVSSLGLPALEQINNGQMPGDINNNTITINFTINTSGELTEADVKSKVMPPIMQALRRNSLDGKFIIATSGARNA